MIVGQISIPVLGRLARGEALLTLKGRGEGETVLDEADARELMARLILAEVPEGTPEGESSVIVVDFKARRRANPKF